MNNNWKITKEKYAIFFAIKGLQTQANKSDVVACSNSADIMMRITLVLGLVIAVATATPVRFRRSSQTTYKMCVPEQILSDCEQMAAAETKSSAKIVCIPARDRMDCLDKIQHRSADFLAVDPEDMYVGMNMAEQDFNVFQEIRTKEEPDAAHRYEAVAVIHKDLEIKSLEGLKGLKSCHTGVGRNVGYKIPLTKLRKMGLIGGLNDTELSPRENELKALSTLFSKACIVGKWSADPTINLKLKSKYSNLCQLCEHPDVCDYPDKYSGYDGALRCLAHNGGEVAWTKVIYVKKFFGLPVGVTPAVKTEEDASNFAYLCPDGSKIPITDTPCTWAARPWQGFMGNADVIKTIEELRTKITNLDTLGEKTHAPWFESVLILNNKTVVKNNKVIPPRDYLDHSNYTDVIEREYGPPIKVVRFCVTSNIELEKCHLLSKAAFSRDLRPRYDCVHEPNVYECLKAIRDNAADLMSLDAGQLATAKSSYNLKPILTEAHGTKGENYAVAVVKKNSALQSLGDLKGTKSCHPGYNSVAGLNAPLYALIKHDLIKKSSGCSVAKLLSEFFSGGSCMPGANMPENNLSEDVSKKLCQQCVGSDDNQTKRPEIKCSGNHLENYYGNSGAFRCLSDGHGDVAFVEQNTVQDNTDGKNTNEWAKALKSSDYELLCPKGGRAAVDQYENCNLAKIPSNMIVTSNSKSNSNIDEIRHLLVSTSQLFGKRPDIFKMFGTFKEEQDLLFKDSTTGLVSYEEEVQQTYSKLLKESSCSN